MDKIALLCGTTRFPILFAQMARKKSPGTKILAFCIKGFTSDEISTYVDTIYWLNIDDIENLFAILQQEKPTHAAIVGKIDKTIIYKFTKNQQLASFLEKLSDRMDLSILGGIAKRLESLGIKVINSTTYLEEFLAKKGPLTKIHPTDEQLADIKFGFNVARKLAALDIGQTVVVKQKAIVAIEAIEGTDETIKRAGKLVGKGCVVIKTARPKQDMKLDVPVIGTTTIESLNQAGASCLGIEAGKVLMIDRDDLINKAEDFGISIIGV